jgi:thiamine-phosphate pyrophosphorylase
MFSRIQYISQGATPAEHLRHIQQVLDAGCDWIQLRYKKPVDAAFVAVAEEVKKACERYRATFILNDQVQLARELEADGVHLGLSDMPVAEARKIVGNKIIGGTANTLEDVLQRVAENCNYIGLGPFRFTSTKENLSPVLGLEGYQRIQTELAAQNISLPIYAIGGIATEDVAALLQTGVHGIAVSGLVTNYPDKKGLLHQLNNLFYATA